MERTRTIEQLTADLKRMGIDPDGHGERIGETADRHLARVLAEINSNVIVNVYRKTVVK